MDDAVASSTGFLIFLFTVGSGLTATGAGGLGSSSSSSTFALPFLLTMGGGLAGLGEGGL